MPEEQTIIFGIPVPSSDPLFITIVVIHILLGIICVISGFIAMMSRKGRGNHSRWGILRYSVTDFCYDNSLIRHALAGQ